MPSQCSMENDLLGVRLCNLLFHSVLLLRYVLLGFTVTCPGNPGHGSRFIKNTAVDKVVGCVIDFCL